ncbi:MAG: TylF/MycF/NovP-related O-methyltransferase [Salibacteraceae bacterium]
MNNLFDQSRSFDYENGYFATSSTARISKFATHLELFQKSAHLRGEIVECGVFKGNSLFRWIKFRDLFENAMSRKIIAFDMFGEFPETDYEPDKRKRNEFIKETRGGVGISINEIEQILKSQQLYQNIQLVKGNLLETLHMYLQKNDELKISLLHIDVDIYEATKVSLELLFPHVVKGGVVILDDYGAFPGANKAIDAYFEGKYEIQKLPYSHAISFVVK